MLPDLQYYQHYKTVMKLQDLIIEWLRRMYMCLHEINYGIEVCEFRLTTVEKNNSVIKSSTY